MKLRDRIKDFRRIEPSLIRPNPRNWRTHPDQQRNALQSVLADVGIVDAVLVRELADGSFMLVDGHLRAETITSQPVPALVLDIDEAEEAEVLATFDPLGDLAGVDIDAFKGLVESFEAPSVDVKAMLDDIARAEQAFLAEAEQAAAEADEAEAGEDGNDGGAPGGDVPESKYKEQYGVIVICADAAEQETVFNDLQARGLTCKIVVT